MSKIMQYFYIFSKLTTSLVLLLIVIIMGYALLQSYQKVDNLSESLNLSLKPLNELISKNKDNYLKLEKKFNSVEIKFDEIKIVIDKKLSLNNKEKIKKDIENLLTINSSLQNQINQLSDNIINIKNNKNLIFSKKKNKINSLKELIILKYKSGESVKDDITYLESISKIKSNNFEKIYTIEFKKFYGLKNLDNEFNLSSKKYINNKFVNEDKNSLLNFLFKFVSIKPSNLKIYHNEELNILNQAKKFVEQEKIENALEKILLIDSKKKYFTKWIEQSEMYIEFINEIKKVT